MSLHTKLQEKVEEQERKIQELEAELRIYREYVPVLINIVQSMQDIMEGEKMQTFLASIQPKKE